MRAGLMQTPPVTGEINNYLVVSTGLGSINLSLCGIGGRAIIANTGSEIDNYLV